GAAAFNEAVTVGNGAGNDYLGFAAEATNPGCAAGNYRVWANSVSQTIKKCENGVISDIGSASGGATTLQTAYDAGAIITTSSARDVAITLADTATDSNFAISIADNSTSTVSITRANGTGTNDPAQLLLLD